MRTLEPAPSTKAIAVATGDFGGDLQGTHRLVLAFGLQVVVFLVMTGFGIWTMTDFARQAHDTVGAAMPRERIVQDWLGEIQVHARLAAADGAQASGLDAVTQRIARHQKEMEAAITSEEGRVLLLAAADRHRQYLAAALAREAQREAALNAYVATLHKLKEFARSETDTFAQRAQSRARSGRITFVVLAVLVLTLAAVILAWIIASVTRPLIKSMRIVESFTSGDLSRSIRISSMGESRRLISALETLRLSLSRQAVAIRNAARGVGTVAAEIERGNTDLSRRTEAQASALEQTASSLEELITAVQHNSDSAAKADQLAAEAARVAQRGGAAVRAVVKTVGGIAESSQRIADIVGIIDSIAFQTNILSLNAAVEAARAGEQGRGFAVVASEVRALAQRSSTAAREIRVLIDDTVGRVSASAGEAEAAGNTMNEIVAAVQRVNELVSTIAVASREQLAGLQQIGSAVSHMDNATQQNAALVERTMAAAGHMGVQVQNLMDMVSRIRLAREFAAEA